MRRAQLRRVSIIGMDWLIAARRASPCDFISRALPYLTCPICPIRSTCPAYPAPRSDPARDGIAFGRRRHGAEHFTDLHRRVARQHVRRIQQRHRQFRDRRPHLRLLAARLHAAGLPAIRRSHRSVILPAFGRCRGAERLADHAALCARSGCRSRADQAPDCAPFPGGVAPTTMSANVASPCTAMGWHDPCKYTGRYTRQCTRPE